MIFESHAHYDDRKFHEDRESLIQSLPENDIKFVVNVGSDIQSTKESLLLAEKYPFFYAACGVHPSDVEQLNEDTFLWLKKQLKHEKCVAVGEIGLDYYWDKEPNVRDNQKYWFRRQLNLAREENLPIIVHSRDAAKDTLDIIKSEKAGEIGGVIHCFSYSVEMAREYLNMGFLYWNRRRSHLQQRQGAKGSDPVRTAEPDSPGDGLPVPGPCAQPGKTKFLPQSEVYCPGHS